MKVWYFHVLFLLRREGGVEFWFTAWNIYADSGADTLVKNDCSSIQIRKYGS